jgi:hypothetical protein
MSPYKLATCKSLYVLSLTFIYPSQIQDTEVCLVFTQSVQVYGKRLCLVRVAVMSLLNSIIVETLILKVNVKLLHYRPLLLQEVEPSRICRQSAHEDGLVVSPTHRPPPLRARRCAWYSFLLEAESTSDRPLVLQEGEAPRSSRQYVQTLLLTQPIKKLSNFYGT